jgi:hypothetical protein
VCGFLDSLFSWHKNKVLIFLRRPFFEASVFASFHPLTNLPMKLITIFNLSRIRGWKFSENPNFLKIYSKIPWSQYLSPLEIITHGTLSLLFRWRFLRAGIKALRFLVISVNDFWYLPYKLLFLRNFIIYYLSCLNLQ